MRILVTLSLALLGSGCTEVVLPSPVGKRAPAGDVAQLKGEWVGERGVVWNVDSDPGTQDLIARSTDDGKEQRVRICISDVGDNVWILWAENTALKGFLPLRLIATVDGNSVVLLTSDAKEVESLVNRSKVAGTFNKEEKAWILTKGDFESLLAGKAFWDLGNDLVFRRQNADGPKSGETGKPASP